MWKENLFQIDVQDALCVTDRHLSEVMILCEDGIFGGKRQIIKYPWDAFAEKLLWKPARGWGGNSEPRKDIGVH